MSKVIAALVAVAMLCVGLYLGGHPESLPQPVRDVFVDDSHVAAGSGARRDQGQLHPQGAQTGSSTTPRCGGWCASLHSRFSHYFTKRENQLFRESTSGQFSGVGMTVTERKRGLLVAGVFKRSPARAGRHQAGRRDHARQRQVDRGQARGGVHRADQGQAGNLRAPDDRPAHRQDPHRPRAAGEDPGAGRGGHDAAGERAQGGSASARLLHVRGARPAGAEDQ